MFRTVPSIESSFPNEICSWWDSAAMSMEQGDPFCCGSIWQLTFHEVMGPPDRRLLFSADGGDMLAFAESFSPSGTALITPIESGWFYGSPLLGRGAVRMFRELLPHIREEMPSLPPIAIGAVEPGHLTAHLLFRYFEKDFNFFRASRTEPCAASLLGGYDGFLANRSSNFRCKLKKAFRRAKERGLTFIEPPLSSDAEADDAFGRVLEVEKKSWKGLSGCGIDTEPYSAFYASMLRRLARAGDARLLFAEADGRDIGYIFGGVMGPHYRGQQFSFDSDWRAYSVGDLLQAEQVRRLCGEGILFYHMGSKTGERMGYKEHWTELTFPIETWIMKQK